MFTWMLIGLGLMLAAFAVVWAIGVKIRNYSFLDVIWSCGVAILAPIYAAVGPGRPERKFAFVALGVAWSLRLGTYIFSRVLKQHPREDVRYEGLRVRWPGAGMFLVFHELQAVIVVLFSLPFLLAAWRDESLRLPDIVGLGIVVIALAGESLADYQMKRFKAGIPLTEEYALKSKGDAYREYQRTTSAFVPWFRKA